MKSQYSHTALRKVRHVTMLGVFVCVLFTSSGHSLVAGGQGSNPDLSGKWESKHKPDSNWADTSVTQEGNSLTFHNEYGGKSKGHFASPNEVVADEWENGLRAKVSEGGSRLEWANGSVWRRKETSLAGSWESDFKKGTWEPTTIRQEGRKLWFTNEFGDTSEGAFESQTRVKADKWEGGLGATIENSDRIRWDNGTIWRRRQ
jgi:hypothetical protein